jgi:hypothetical protein
MSNNINMQVVRPFKRPVGRPRKIRPITVRHTDSTIFTKYVGRMHVAPQQQLQMSLGVFGADRPVRGFSIDLSPDPESDESVVAQILSVGSDQRFELILNIANVGERAVTADVWQM